LVPPHTVLSTASLGMVGGAKASTSLGIIKKLDYGQAVAAMPPN